MATIMQLVAVHEQKPPECRGEWFDLSTEFDDGRFVTSNRTRQYFLTSASEMPEVTEIDWKKFAPSCSLDEVLQSHEERVQAAMAIAQDVRPICMSNLEDFIASAKRMQVLVGQQMRTIAAADFMRGYSAPGRRRAKFVQLLTAEVERLQSCPKCGYNLTGNEAGACPECATPTPESQSR